MSSNPKTNTRQTKCLINGTFIHKKSAGLGVYTIEIMKAMIDLKTSNEVHVITSSRDMKNAHPDYVTHAPFFTSPDHGHFSRLNWIEIFLPHYLKRVGSSVIYSPVPEGVLFSKAKQVITIHDVLPLKYPQYYPRMRYIFRYYLPKLLKNSSTIICVSQNTKKDVMAYFHIDEKKIRVIYNGYDAHVFQPNKNSSAPKKFRLKNYILFAGAFRPYKNLENSLKAFAEEKDSSDLQFCITGGMEKRFNKKIMRTIQDLSIQDRVFFLGYVSQPDLAGLYQGAQALIYPSLYEGFGLPLLEAMASACPVITSRKASIPEVCQDAACYVDPHSHEDIARGISKILSDREFRSALIEKGLQRAQRFSWKKTATQIFHVIEDVHAS